MINLGIFEKLQTELAGSPFDAVLVFGTDNIRYCTGAALPFLHAYPLDCIAAVAARDKAPLVIAPAELKDTVKAAGRIRNIRVYSAQTAGAGEEESRESVIADTLRTLGLEKARIGVTERRISTALFRLLKKKLSAAEFIPCDRWMAELRMTKTAGEQNLLEDIALKTDHALAGAMHHVMVYADRPEKGLSEIIRVHGIERGLDMSGYESLAIGASGKHAAEPWPEAPFYGVGLGKRLEEQEMVRLELRATRNGYWSDASRILTMGPPSPAQEEKYGQVSAVRNEAVRVLRPGLSCSKAAEQILGFCSAKNIDLVPEHGLGHGIGVSAVEPPYINPSDMTELKEGMVLVLTHTIRGPLGELLRSYDTVVLRKDTATIVGWYKDWNEPYKAVRSYQHGGG